jgi:5-methylcytosine-specific restriction endonuclease McrA
MTKEERQKYNRAYREANREQIAEKKRAYRAANREKIREYNRAYREANPEQIAELNRAYRAANPEQTRAASARRRARENNVEHDETWPSFPLHEACEYCGETEDLQCDHIYPVALGGAYTIGNYQTLCQPCNSAKNDTPEDELPPNFIEERIRLRRRREKDRARRLRK